MRLHWKLLWVLLFISLVPMFFIGGTDKRLMGKMGNDLATKTRDALTRQATLGLKSLVAEHAKILKRERDIVEMALQIQAAGLEQKFRRKFDQSELVSSPNTTDTINPAWIETHPSSKYFRFMEHMRDGSLPVSYQEQTYHVPSSVSKKEAVKIVSRISGMDSIYRSLKHKHPDLIVWQFTALENGIQTVYPAVKRLPMMYSMFKTKWYQLAKEKKEIVWSPPMMDPFTMQIMSIVSTPFSRPDGSLIGVTAIAVPVNTLIQDSKQLRGLSKNCTALLVRSENPVDSGSTGIRIIAQERVRKEVGNYWWAPSKEEWFEVEDRPQLGQLTKDLQNHNTDVREITYQGRQSLMAYGPIDDYQTGLLVIVPKADIVAEAVAMEKYVNERVGRQIRVASIILLAVIPAVIFLALTLSKSVTQNISKLVAACRRVGSGDFTTRIQIDSSDEIGELGKTFNRMIPTLGEHVKMKQALELAMEVQQNLLPQKTPEIEGLDIAGRSIYCDETGGDYYDFLEVCCRNSDHIGIAVGDVAGHGISAALLMASARAFLRSRVTQPGSVAEIVTDINRLVSYDTGETGQFMTLFYVEIDPSEKTLNWVRAGHDPALLYESAPDSFKELGGEGMALGVDGGYAYREGGRIGLLEGQILLIGTDGLWETQNESGEMFGKERLKSVIRRQAGFPAKVILSAILDSLSEFRKSAKQEDDVTFTVIKVVG